MGLDSEVMKGDSMLNIKKKSSVAAVAVAALAASSLALTGSVAAQAAEPTSFSLYVPAWQSGDSPYVAVANAFMKAYPNYKVKVTQVAGDAYSNGLQTSLQAGNGPDVFRTEPGNGNTMSLVPLAKKGFLRSLNATAARSVNPSSAAADLSVGGQIYGVSLDLTAGSMVANETLMKADGVTWPSTFGDLLDACTAAKKKGKSFIALAGAISANTGLFGMSIIGGDLYLGDPTWNSRRAAGKVTFAGSAGWKTALNKVVQMKNANCFQDGAAGADFGSGIDANFFAHKAYAVFVPGSTSVVFKRFVPPTRGEDIVTEAFPGTTAAQTAVPAAVNYSLSVNAKTKATKAVNAFINFVASKDGQVTYQKLSGGLPTTAKLTASNVPDADAYRNVIALVNAKKTYPFPDKGFSNGAVYVALGTGIQGLITGQATVAQVLQSMDAAWGQ
jgi:raffinose/stachyose/melibiose transport system substrate-binding protein